jgi:hypothetical protein
VQTWLKSSLWREPNVPARLLRAVFGNVTTPAPTLALVTR